MMLPATGLIAQAGARATPAPLTLPTTNLLEAWDARSGITEAGTGVSSWLGLHAGHNAAQTNDAKRPSLTTTGGYASLLFNGTSDALQISGLTAAASTKSIYAVVNPTTVGAAYRLIFDVQTGRLAFGTMSTGGGDWGVYDVANRDSGVDATTGLQRLSAEVLSGSSRVWINGTVGATTGWAADSAIGGNVAIGASSAATSFCFAGHILFLAIYTAARNTDVEDYITQEWGV